MSTTGEQLDDQASRRDQLKSILVPCPDLVGFSKQLPALHPRSMTRQ